VLLLFGAVFLFGGIERNGTAKKSQNSGAKHVSFFFRNQTRKFVR
jgi:hypothetical protein